MLDLEVNAESNKCVFMSYLAGCSTKLQDEVTHNFFENVT
jgi:hypothetical protein